MSGNSDTNTAQTIRVFNNSFILAPELKKQYNALLRGEQCTAEVNAHRLNHKTHRMLKMPRIANPT
ncbi:hypothetical protein FOB71_16930 [Vibrio vulnificus]|nr:hypothetical protein FOB71_16930 [Vibrio vulnificus]